MNKSKQKRVNMKTKIVLTTSLVILFSLILFACTPKAPTVIIFTVSGVAERTYTQGDLLALPQTASDYTNKHNETTNYTGVSFKDLLDSLSLIPEATTVTMIASDAYQAEVSAEELNNCADCIIAILDNGSLQAVLPRFSTKLNVKNLIEINIQ